MQGEDQIEQLECSLRDSPGDLSEWLSLIEAYLQSGALARALDATGRALASTGTTPKLEQLHQTLLGILEPASEPWADELNHLIATVDRQDFTTAVELGEVFVQRWPDKPDAWGLLAESRYRLGNFNGAILAGSRAVELSPESACAHANLGTLLSAAGDIDKAEASLKRALEIDPHYSAAHASMAHVLRKRGDLLAAEASLRLALAFTPGQADIHYNWGNVLEALGELDQAEAQYRQALNLNPKLAAAANNLGGLLLAQRRFQDARDMLQHAITLAPDLAQAHCNLGKVLRLLDQPEAAVNAFERALALVPDMFDALSTLALTLGQLDHFDRSVELFERALLLQPENTRVFVYLADALKGMGDLDRAEACYRRALEREPGEVQIIVSLAVVEGERKRYFEALGTLDEALRIDPKSVAALNVQARILMEIGELEESESRFREAIAHASDPNVIYSNLLVAMSFSGHWSAVKLRQESEKWELLALSAAERIAARNQTFQRRPRPGRKLRLGLVSAELGQHAVSYFLRAWLGALNRSQFEIYIFSGRNRRDEKEASFQELADYWESIAALSDSEVARRIRNHDIDILIETTGHDPYSRLGVIARRVAPVQCHYIGYYATTGLSEMDYFIADAVLVPKEHDHHFTERVWRLPRTRYAYEPLESAPQPRWSPDPDGQLWIGSFNNLIKVREESLALWARVLHAIPEARLALKDNKGANRATQERILRTLEAHGISKQRVAFMDWVPSWVEHMAYYNHLDVALDSVPFNSATTGFDALWMGCPLVTLEGGDLAGRQAASLLTGLGRSEWIAATEEDYVRIVLELAGNKEERRRIRLHQREQMRASELCDGPGLAGALSQAFEVMYERWWQLQTQRPGTSSGRA